MTPASLPCGRVEALTRRDLLRRAGGGLGGLAMAALMQRTAGFAASHPPLMIPKAKAVIWLFMQGGPSAFDLFDPKPELDRNHGKKSDIPTFFNKNGALLKSPFSFRQYGQSGAWMSEVLPETARHVDSLAFVKSCWCESSNHVPAMFQMNTGFSRPGFPSAGSWITYGLGAVTENLPGFVVIGTKTGTKGGPLNWTNGFLPSSCQGTVFRPGANPVLNLNLPPSLTREDQRAQLDFLAGVNRGHAEQHPDNPELSARMANFELAYRMQSAGGELLDISGESDATRTLYGMDRTESGDFGRKCLTARRLVERGVRFVQVYCNEEWDAHADIAGNHRSMAAQVDRGTAGLLADLKQRGLLEETLVIWGGEFGRMPVSEGSLGRDHNPHGFGLWLAGGGIRGGVSYGATDEIGYKAAENPVSIPDLHATLLHLLGIDHEALTFLHNSRHFRLTDVSGQVLRQILV